MALLNFVSKYQDVAKYKDLTVSSPSLSGSQENDYVKLIFTKDGHIITHGTDYIPWGNGTIPIDKLPITDGNNPDNKHLWDSATINQKINDSYVINSAMRFKGTIGLNPTYNGTSDTKKYLVNDVKSDIPSAQVGDTYRVTKSGNYEGFQCEAGDLLMCITASDTNKAATWTVAQTNINGTVDFVINGKVHKIYSNDTSGLTMFAPVSAGTSGNILISGGTGSAPTWANPANLTIGTANKVSNSLSNGAGIVAFSYNGSSAKKVALAPATATTIGGVIVDAAGDKPTISVDANGKISLTATNVRNALGYDPVGVNNWRPVYVDGEEFQGSATDTGNLSIKHGLGITITKDTSTHVITFRANTNYTTSGKNYKVEADSSTGGLYVNVPWTNSTYGIVSNTSDGLAPKVINTNTTLINNAFYLLASSNGTATPSWYKLPASAFANTWRDIKIKGTSIGSNTLNLLEGSHITLSNSNGTVTINSTWRDIKIGNSSIGNKALNIDASGDIYVAKTETDNMVTIDFGISWYNLDTGQYEIV